MIVYLMIHVPFIWWWKIGFAHYSFVRRAVALDKAVFGIFIPVGVIIIPSASPVEQWFHRKFRPLHFRFYRGDGSTETYWFIVAPFVYAAMCAVWFMYFYLAGKCFHFDGTAYFCSFMDWQWCFVKALWLTLKEWYQFIYQATH